MSQSILSSKRIADMANNKLEIGKVLTTLMKQKNLTFKKLSEATGVSQSTLKSWSSNAEPKSIIQMKKVCDFFGCSIEYLLFGEDEQSNLNLESLMTERLFSGWLKVTIESVAGKPITKKIVIDDE